MTQSLVGRVFGRLTVTAKCDGGWSCVCACGRCLTVITGLLNAGRVRSCGCLRREHAAQLKRTHGLRHTPEYASWSHAKRRCEWPLDKAYPNYGARGIAMCERWRKSFAAFIEDMGRCPAMHSLDRIDNDGNYEPRNCRWALRAVQNSNRRNTCRLTLNGRTQGMSQWAKELGMPVSAFRWRWDAGWTDEQILSTPSRRRK